MKDEDLIREFFKIALQTLAVEATKAAVETIKGIIEARLAAEREADAPANDEGDADT